MGTVAFFLVCCILLSFAVWGKEGHGTGWLSAGRRDPKLTSRLYLVSQVGWYQWTVLYNSKETEGVSTSAGERGHSVLQ